VRESLLENRRVKKQPAKRRFRTRSEANCSTVTADVVIDKARRVGFRCGGQEESQR
jgi:hypothetical protein